MLKISTLPNGLVLIVEEIDYVASVAYELLIPGGIIHDDSNTLGASLMLAELSARGAGDYDSRGLSDAFDSRGIRHSEAAKKDCFTYRGSALATELPAALELVASMIMRPHFPESELENVRSYFIQDIRSLDDDPASKALIALQDKYYPEPYGRSSYGTLEGLNNTNLDAIKQLWEKAYRPQGAILSVAGNVKYSDVESLVLKVFNGWEGSALKKPEFGSVSTGGYYHIDTDSAQTQITLACKSAPFEDENYYAAKVANGILSGGMFGRLFVEVREKLGLCYTVYSRQSATRDYGTVQAYAGTVPERADKTLEVMLREMRNLKGTVTVEELERAKANFLAGCIIGEESVAAKASSNVADYWLLGRIRPMSEVTEKINEIMISDIDRYCEAFPLKDYTVLTLGSKRLDHVL